ncbi:MAG: TIR domain-containing protein [Methanobacterium sp.]
MFNDDSKIYKLFISHLNDDDEYTLFISKLDTSYDFEWKDYAVNNEMNHMKLAEQMKLADVIIILSGLYIKNRKLLQKEIDVAIELEKPIVVVRPYGMENVPSNLEKIATEVVGWNTPCIVDSIKEALGEDVID